MKNIFFIFLLVSLLSCRKQKISTDEVINSLQLSPNVIDADGTSTINVSVKINKDADVSKRKIVLETSSGVFTSNSTKTNTVDALYENGELIARASVKSPISPGYIVITAKPENRNPYNDFIIKDSVQAVPSLPFSISISASAFGVQTGYINEIQIIGTLKNQKNKNVSSGTKVAFTDVLPNGTPIGGRFRQVQSNSDDNSKVSAYYSPGFVVPGTNFYIRVTVLDSNGNPTTITDAILLTVIP